MIGLEFDFPSTMSDVNEAGYEFAYPETRPFQLPLPQEGLDDAFLSGSYEQVPAASSGQPIPVPALNQSVAAGESPVSPSSPVVPVSVPSQTSWPVTSKRGHPPVERETKVKKRKQQHQQKDKERRHRINEGLKQLGNLVQSATGTFARLDQPTIVSSSIGLIKSLQAELSSLRAQLSGKSGNVKEEKNSTTVAHNHQGHSDGACPVFSSVAGAGVALLMIRADDLSIVEANSVLANILGHTSADGLLGTAVWDAPLHSRLYQLDSHGRVVNDNSNPFAFQPKVKVEDDGMAKAEETNHIDCLWAARTANGNTLNARVTLSVLKGDDAKPTHFLLCSLPSQRNVTPAPALQSGGMETSSMAEVEVAC